MNSEIKIKFLSFLITVTMLLSGLTFGVHAATEIGYEVSLSNSVTGIGGEVVLTVALTNYSAQSEQIRGLQIDIGNIDTDVLSVVSYNSLIVDSTAVSNTASYSQNNSRIRLVYANFSGTLPVSNGEDGRMKVFEVKFKINGNLETDGQVELPVTVKMQTMGEQITLGSMETIQYREINVQTPDEGDLDNSESNTNDSGNVGETVSTLDRTVIMMTIVILGLLSLLVVACAVIKRKRR